MFEGSVNPSGSSVSTTINTTLLCKTIEATLLTAYLKNEQPTSLLIVAKPESGKTTIMKRYRFNKGIVYVTDCTAYGITRDILPKFVSGEAKTLMIADLLTPLSKAAKTRESFIAFLNNLVEEGIAKTTTYATIWDKEVKANLITAVTDEAIRDGRHDWAKMGFLSRFIMFSYSYNFSTVAQILEQYSKHGSRLGPVKFKLPKKEVSIQLPQELADKLNPLAVKIGEEFNLYGIRAKINLRSFIKALALRNHATIVSEKEYAELLELYDYMNFKFNPLR
jgi:hypothetical protein